jgi:hypothetical protein
MSRPGLFLPLIGLLALAGCGRGSAPQQAQETPQPDAAATPQTSYRDTLRKLPPAEVSAALFRAISDSGESCTGVTKSAYQQDYKDMGMWVAHCRAGGDWAVFVSDKGYVQARACPTAAQSGFPACKPL